MKNYTYYRDLLSEFGMVEKLNHPVATLSGLPMGKPHEMVICESGEIGEIMSLHEKYANVLFFSRQPISVGTKLARTNRTVTVPVGNELLGHIITPLGTGFTLSEKIEPGCEEREIDIKPPGIYARSRIHKPFTTGTTIVDVMVPLGKGQKELIIGDRRTGKSSFLFTSMRTQISEGTIVIYAVIGKRKSDIKKLSENIRENNMFQSTVIVAACSDDAPSLIFLTPFTAMTIAEYFRDQGRDVLLILDDLSVHAKVYREISLLSNNFPGRDSYPGDIFYTHARLLERAGNFKHPQKSEVSITCLPVVETVEGDVTGYIPTNSMGITDGHIFFDSNIFYKGQRPAVNMLLSVTRVGKQTQKAAKREMTRELSTFFAEYEKMQNLSHFGSELTENVKNILASGDKLLAFFNQDYHVIIPENVQMIILSLLWLNLIPGSIQSLISLRDDLIASLAIKDNEALFTEILDADSFAHIVKNVASHKDKIFSLWKNRENF